MKKIMIIMVICCVSINLCACGQSVLVSENDSAEQTVVEDGISSSLDITETMTDAKTESMSVKENVSEAIGDENKTAMLWNDSELEDWKQAYLNYLDTLAGADSCAYSLIYVDDDEVPELVVDYGLDGGRTRIDGGCRAILTFHDHVLDEWKPLRSRFTYIERKNVICNIYNGVDVNEQSHHDMVFTIQDGKWVYVDGGGYRESVDTSAIPVKIAMLFGGEIDEEKYLIQEYYWGDTDEQISEEEYAVRLNAIYPEGQGMYPQKYYILDDICSIISTGDVASAAHRYELIVEDVTWEEAAARCQEKGGYLATITSEEEMGWVQAQVISEHKTDITFFVGSKKWKWLEHGTEEIDMMSLYTVLDFWLGGELEYRDGEPYFVLLYQESDKRCYFDEVANDILEAEPSYAGKIGYICEYDN